MTNIQFLDSTKKKKIISELEVFGVDSIPYLLLKFGKERVRAYSGSMSNKELYNICSFLPVELIGIYFGKEVNGGEFENFRLSTDALHALQSQIDKNIVDLLPEQEKEWFFGSNINLSEEQQKKYQDLKGFVAMRSGQDFLGIGKISNDKKLISNFLPKERRRRKMG